MTAPFRNFVSPLAWFVAAAFAQALLAAIPGLQSPPYLAFYPAVMLAAIYGTAPVSIAVAMLSSFGPAILGAILPQANIAVPHPGTQCAFVVFSLLVVWATSSARGALSDRQKLNRQLAAIVESSDDAIVSVNRDGIVTSWNGGAERVYGYRATDAIGKHVSFLYPPELAGEEDAILSRVARGERIDHYETTRVRVDGRPIAVSLSSSPIFDESGQVVGAAKIARDVSERRAAEDLFHSLADAAPVLIWTSDPDGKLVWFNRQWLEFRGTSLAEESSVNTDERIYPGDVRLVLETFRVARTERLPFDVEFRLKRRDGTYRWILNRGIPLHDPAMRFRGYIGSGIDITDFKQSEAERARLLSNEHDARVEAERASRAKDQFLAMVSHELRTPLNAILGWTQLLKRKTATSGPFGEGLDVIERNVRLQSKIIEELLDMSRIISGKIRLERKPVAVRRLLDEAVSTLAPIAADAGVRLTLETGGQLGEIEADPGRLQQVLWNLITNALKFTPRNGFVTVHARGAPDSVRIAIVDSGKGIEPDFLPYVFDGFRQAESPGTRIHGGLGIGLSITRHLVQLHGGTISAVSGGEGRGAEFQIELPRLAAQAARAEPKPAVHTNAARPLPVLSDIRALVVDDEPDARALFSQVLESCGASVAAAGSAPEALRLVERGAFDILVSDIALPGEDGYSLLQRIRKLPADRGGRLPAIAVTAFARPEDRSRALAAGFREHLTKPVGADELALAVASLVRGPGSAAGIIEAAK